jgi:hypothetical protein
LETKSIGRRAILGMLPVLAGCVEIGRPWPDLTEAQQAKRDAWIAELDKHVAAVLTQAGMRLSPIRPTSTDDPARTFTVSLDVDRSGYIHLVKVAKPSTARPGTDRFVLTKLTEAGPVPAPPPSLIALNNRLTVTVRMISRGARGTAAT